MDKIKDLYLDWVSKEEKAAATHKELATNLKKARDAERAFHKEAGKLAGNSCAIPSIRINRGDVIPMPHDDRFILKI